MLYGGSTHFQNHLEGSWVLPGEVLFSNEYLASQCSVYGTAEDQLMGTISQESLVCYEVGRAVDSSGHMGTSWDFSLVMSTMRNTMVPNWFGAGVEVGEMHDDQTLYSDLHLKTSLLLLSRE